MASTAFAAVATAHCTAALCSVHNSIAVPHSDVDVLTGIYINLSATAHKQGFVNDTKHAGNR
eukprot:5168-Heterococcus_DN1.PRE.3